ncbi:MAG: hypothetical protein RR313_00045 [Anaerovoracaceae bacterium]
MRAVDLVITAYSADLKQNKPLGSLKCKDTLLCKIYGVSTFTVKQQMQNSPAHVAVSDMCIQLTRGWPSFRRMRVLNKRVNSGFWVAECFPIVSYMEFRWYPSKEIALAVYNKVPFPTPKKLLQVQAQTVLTLREDTWFIEEENL